MAAAAQFAKEEQFTDAELEFAARIQFAYKPAELLSLYDAAVLRKAISLLQAKCGVNRKYLARRLEVSSRTIYHWTRGEITYRRAHAVWLELEGVWREHYQVAA